MRVLRFFGRWAYRLVAFLGFITLALIIAGVVIGWQVSTRFAAPKVAVTEDVVLTADWRGGISERADGFSPLADLGINGDPSLPGLLLALDRAADDDRVKGLVVRIDGEGFGLAQAWELRAAVERLRAAGKFTALYADSLGELEGGVVGTYLASAFEHVQLQPLGTVGFTGLAADQLYLRRLLDGLGIEMQAIQREAYKSALEPLTRDGPSPAAAANLDALLDGLYAQILDGVAEARGIDPSTVRLAVDRGPLLGSEALDAGLIDAIGHLPELWSRVDDASGTEQRLDLNDYASVGAASSDDAATFGFVHAVGPIRRGESEGLGDLDVAGDSVAAAIDAAIDAEVEALVLRVASPGGSAVASETIGAAVRRAKAAGIPVVVSMGDVAASGGYWISMDADRIVAAPTTLTGSIGVIAGKPALGPFLEDRGIDVVTARRGGNAGVSSLIEPWDATTQARLETVVDDLYGAFLEGVASGRGMDVDAVRAVAGGRVWLGTDAVTNGLVDELGGFVRAMDVAREEAGIPVDATVRLEVFPRTRAPLELALEELDRFLELRASLAGLWATLEAATTPSVRLDAGPLPRAD